MVICQRVVVRSCAVLIVLIRIRYWEPLVLGEDSIVDERKDLVIRN